MVDLKGEMQTELAKTNQVVVDLKGEMQTGFARMERRLAWYLVAVAAMIVGFGLTVWIPLMNTVHEQSTPTTPTAITTTESTTTHSPHLQNARSPQMLWDSSIA